MMNTERIHTITTQSRAQELLRQTGVEIDASDHRSPLEIAQSLARVGIVSPYQLWLSRG